MPMQEPRSDSKAQVDGEDDDQGTLQPRLTSPPPIQEVLKPVVRWQRIRRDGTKAPAQPRRVDRHACPHSRYDNTLVWSRILDEEQYRQKRHDVEKEDRHQEATALDLVSAVHWHPLRIVVT